LVEHGAFELAQFAAGLYAEPFHQPATGALESGQRVGLATGAVQRRHELGVQVLPVLVGGDGRLQFGDELARVAQLQPSIEQRFQGD
jgi:hypothetical protein